MKTLAVREVKDTPYLLSTDRHVLQGTLDAHDVTAQGNTVTGAFDVVAGDPYKAVIALGNNRLKVKSLRTDPQIKADYVLDTFHNVVEITLQSDKNVTASVTLTLEEREAGTDTQAPGAPSALLTAAAKARPYEKLYALFANDALRTQFQPAMWNTRFSGEAHLTLLLPPLTS